MQVDGGFVTIGKIDFCILGLTRKDIYLTCTLGVRYKRKKKT